MMNASRFLVGLSLVFLAFSSPFSLSAQATIEQICTLSAYSGSGHAMWFRDLPGAATRKFDFFPPGASLTLFSDGTAQISGRIFLKSDSTKQWDVEIRLINRRDFATWDSLGGGVKIQNAPPALVQANQQDWLFFELDSTQSLLRGVPGTFYDGDSLTLTHRPADLSFGFQLGIAANAKNGNYGLSGWFDFGGSYAGVGDINVNADCDTVPPCDLAADTLYAQCITDSTFELVLSFTGSGNQYQLQDDQGSPPWTGLSPGTYTFGNYASNTQVSLSLSDPNHPNPCSLDLGPVTTQCEPPCMVMLDTLYAQCKTDSTFELVVSFSGVGNQFQISDDQGSPPLPGLSPGTYTYGEYLNSTDVFVTVSHPNLGGCSDQLGPVTADCTPVPMCDVVLDSAYTQCLSDSSFEVVVSFSGTGNFFQIFDDQGSVIQTGLSAGTYSYGQYLNGTQVVVSILDFSIFNCQVDTDTLTDSCVTANVQVGAAYPNPARGRVWLNLRLNENQPPTVLYCELIDLQGRVRSRMQEWLQPGTQKMSLDCSPYPPGLYFLHMWVEDQALAAQRILIWNY